MDVEEIEIKITIKGLKIDDPIAFHYLTGWIREETRAGLLGNSKFLFSWSGDANDLDVEIVKTRPNPDLFDR